VRSIELAYDVDAPPDEVFSRLTDFDALTTWRTLESIRREPEGQLQVGTRLYSLVKGPGGLMRFTNEVTSVDPQQRVYADRWLDGTFPIESAWRIEPKDGQGARIHWTTHYEPGGRMRLISPLLGTLIRRGQLQDLKKFSALLEH
jgi:uncharacterized protein YndB with AHSA1/START domain